MCPPPPSKSPQVLTGVDRDYFESIWDGAFVWIISDVRSSDKTAESNGSLYDSIRIKAAFSLFYFFLAEKYFFLTLVFIYSYMSVCFRTGCSVQHVIFGNKWICNMYAFSLRFIFRIFSLSFLLLSLFFFFFSPFKWQLSNPYETAVSFTIIFNCKIWFFSLKSSSCQ